VGFDNKGICTFNNVTRTTKSTSPTTTSTKTEGVNDDEINTSNIDFTTPNIDILQDMDNEKMLRELEDFSNQLLSPEGIEEIFDTVSDEFGSTSTDESGEGAGLNIQSIMVDGQEIKVEILPAPQDDDEDQTTIKSSPGLSLPVLEPEFHFLNMPSSPNFYSPTLQANKEQEKKNPLMEFNPEDERLLEFNSLLELKQFENNTFGFSDDSHNGEDDLELSEADQFFTEFSLSL